MNTRSIAALVAAFLLTFLGGKSLLGSRPSEWPLQPLEVQSARGISGQVARVQQEIAAIASGDPALAQRLYGLAQAVQQIDRNDEELRGEASKRCGVAVVQSGSAWVRK